MSTTLIKGSNTQVPSQQLIVQASHAGVMTDLFAISLGQGGKVSSENDFIFHGRQSSSGGSVRYSNKTAADGRYNHSFSVDLKSVPSSIERIKLALAIDAATKTFADVNDLTISLYDSSGTELVSFKAEGTNENVLIVAEFYRRDGAWKVRHIAQGYTGGLAATAAQFGIDAAASKRIAAIGSPAPVTAAAVTAKAEGKISLSKTEQVTAQLEKSGSRLLSLQKAAAISLQKHKVEARAKVVMVLDASGSTRRMWPAIMQGVTDRLATLALNLDDDGELELWVYATEFRKMATVNLANLDGYIARLQQGGDGSQTTTNPGGNSSNKGGWFSSSSSDGYVIPGLGYDNNEPPVMEAILTGCSKTDSLPTLVLFVTDGGIDKDPAIEKLLIEASHYPIFWQFVGLGGSGYGVLERFDKMEGRYVDNAGFFALDDYRSIADAELYSRLIKEFPLWLQKVKALGMLA
jgi:stress response protein SCP2